MTLFWVKPALKIFVFRILTTISSLPALHAVLTFRKFIYYLAKIDSIRDLQGLQFSDVVAGTFYNAFEDKIPVKHVTEYTQILKSQVYRHKGNFWGYGTKIAPREMPYQVENDPKFDWLQHVYTKKVL